MMTMVVSDLELVRVLSLGGGVNVSQLLPPTQVQVSLNQAAGKVDGNHCLVTRLVSVDSEHITRAKHLVGENRLRVILQDTISGDKCYCWLFGEYSDAFIRHGVKPRDFVVLSMPKVRKTKLMYKQVLPADMSWWTVFCLTGERKEITLIRLEEETTVEAEGSAADPSESAISALIEAINNSDSFSIEKSSSPPPAPITATQNIENISPNIPGPSRVRQDRSPAVPQNTLRPRYTFLAQCETHKQKYNVWAIVSSVLETPRRRKSKIVAKLLLTDESLCIAGDLRESFKFDILTDGFEQMPVLEEGSVVRIHHMTVEVFNGKSDGRVFSGHCVTVVVGGPGEEISPESTAQRAGKALSWGEEDNARVRQLREVWAGTRVQERSLEEIKDCGVSSVICRLVAVSRVDGNVILRVEDGTASTIVSVEFRGVDTQTMEQLGDNKMWLDVWVDSWDAKSDVDRLMLDTGDYIKLERLTCALLEDEDRHKSYRFSIESGSIKKLNGDAVKSVMLRLKDSQSQCQDSYIDKLLQGVDQDGTFLAPGTESGGTVSGLSTQDLEMRGEGGHTGIENPQAGEDSQPVTSTQVPGEQVEERSVQEPEEREDSRPISSVEDPEEIIPSSLPAPVVADITGADSQESEEVSLPYPPLAQVPPTPGSTLSSESNLSFSPVTVSGFSQVTSTPESESRNRQPKRQALSSPSPTQRKSKRLRSPKSKEIQEIETPVKPSRSNQSKSKVESMNLSSPRSAFSNSIESSVEDPKSSDIHLPPATEESNDLPTKDSEPEISPKPPSAKADSADDATSEVSANLLSSEPPPPPSESSRPESEPWSQMTQFTTDRSPVRSKQTEATESEKTKAMEVSKPVEISQSQSSSDTFISCNESLTEHNYSKSHIDIDDLLEDFEGNMELSEEENVPIDSLDVNVDENETLTIDNIGKNDTDKTINDEQEEKKQDKTSVSEQQNSSEDYEGGEMEVAAEDSGENVHTEAKSDPLSVAPNKVAGENTVSSYRSNLMVTCEPSCSELPRKDCLGLQTAAPGKYRLLCLINSVEDKDNILKGYCRECGKMDLASNFEEKDGDILCCTKDGKSVKARRKFQIVTNVFDQSVATEEPTKIVINGPIAERFLGVTASDYSRSQDLREETVRKLEALEGKLAEFCVEKISQSRVLYVSNSLVRF